MTAALVVLESPPGWNEESRATGRELGRKAVAKKAATLREFWVAQTIKKLVDDFAYQSHIPTRNELIDNLRAFNSDNKLTGKGGGQVKRATLARWLTPSIENELRVRAIEELIQSAISADRRQR